MSESLWEAEAVEEAKSSEQPQDQPAGALALSADDFSALEERILRAVTLVKQERQARTAAEERATQAEAQLREQEQLMDLFQKDMDALKVERDQIRQRVERLLTQLDALEL
jgi:hypothetical protein